MSGSSQRVYVPLQPEVLLGSSLARVSLYKDEAGIEYAVKQQALTFDHDLSETFVREVAVLSRLKHPHVTSLADFFFTSDQASIVMIPGTPSWNLQPSQLKPFFWDLAQTLYYLHSNGVWHRDIKKENIVMINDKPVLIDFGSASFLRRKTATRDYTLEVTSMIYRAPEILLGQRHDHKADIWSLARVITFEVASYYLFGDNEEDQLARIFFNLGTHETWAWLKTLKLKSNVLNKFAYLQDEKDTKTKVPPALEHTPDGHLLANLIRKMLQIIPDQRIEIEEVLRDPYFNCFTNVELPAQPYFKWQTPRHTWVEDKKWRTTTLFWLFSVVENYHIDRRAFFLAVVYLDAYVELCGRHTKPIAATCLMLASKLVCKVYLTANFICEILRRYDPNLETNDLVVCEQEVLSALHPYLLSVSAYEWYKRASFEASLRKVVRTLLVARVCTKVEPPQKSVAASVDKAQRLKS
jgi:serine/threonine protein kinase